jgi:uncharacterized membrane protein
MALLRKILLVPMAAFYVAIGISHFTNPAFFLQIMPPWIPWHAFCVYASGVAEIGLGLLVLPPATRRIAGLGIIALLIAVFPANIHQAVNQVPMVNRPSWMSEPTPAQLWFRLPMQFVLMAWAWWTTQGDD